MKNSVIVIYIPSQKTQKEKDFLDENLLKLKNSGLHDGFDIIYIEDPARKRAKAEVHFNPYQL